MGPRKLLKQGTLLKAKSRRKLHVLLCSDILVLMDDSMKTLYRLVCKCYLVMFPSLRMPLASLSLLLTLRSRSRNRGQKVRFTSYQVIRQRPNRVSDETTFVLSQTYPRGGDSVALRALSPRDCQREFCSCFTFTLI
jgi:hypothetical protein